MNLLVGFNILYDLIRVLILNFLKINKRKLTVIKYDKLFSVTENMDSELRDYSELDL